MWRAFPFLFIGFFVLAVCALGRVEVLSVFEHHVISPSAWEATCTLRVSAEAPQGKALISFALPLPSNFALVGASARGARVRREEGSLKVSFSKPLVGSGIVEISLKLKREGIAHVGWFAPAYPVDAQRMEVRVSPKGLAAVWADPSVWEEKDRTFWATVKKVSSLYNSLFLSEREIRAEVFTRIEFFAKAGNRAEIKTNIVLLGTSVVGLGLNAVPSPSGKEISGKGILLTWENAPSGTYTIEIRGTVVGRASRFVWAKPAPVPSSPSLGELKGALRGKPKKVVVATLCRLVNRAVRYDPGMAGRELKPWEVLSVGRGVCEHFADALVWLCGQVGVEARRVDGIAYDPLRGEFCPHSWVEAGGFFADPTWGMWGGKPATHIPFSVRVEVEAKGASVILKSPKTAASLL